MIYEDMTVTKEDVDDRKEEGKKVIEEFFYRYLSPDTEEEHHRIDMEGHEALNRNS